MESRQTKWEMNCPTCGGDIPEKFHGPIIDLLKQIVNALEHGQWKDKASALLVEITGPPIERAKRLIKRGDQRWYDFCAS